MKQLNDDDNTKNKKHEKRAEKDEDGRRLIVQFDAIAGFKGHTRYP